MIQTVNFFDFCDAFKQGGCADQFTNEGFQVLFDYLEESDPYYELDVIELCTEYSESTPDKLRANYSDASQLDDERLADWLHDQTIVCGATPQGGLVYADF
jgi:hypothetical protein